MSCMTFEYVCTRNDLADLLEIPHGKLTHVLYVAKVDSFYKIFEIPKKSGGTRKICAPTGDLKQIQEKLYSILLHHQQFLRKQNNIHANISHAFEKGKSIITNGEVHRNKRIVINIDLQDFFDSFHFGRVCGFFEKNRDFAIPHELAIVMAQLTCYQGKLPQGAPTSPIITNYICQIFDMRILKIAKKYHLDYTRYADDLSFSTNDKKFISQWEPFYNELTYEVERAGFKINTKKTSVQYKDSRQTVTGLVINKKISVDHRYYKQVRAMADSLYKTGCFDNNGVEGTVSQLEGKFAFIDQLDKYNNIKDVGQQHSVFCLNGREKQYQKFLFYRYFFAHEKPVIVTEGKTDIKYIKAALKNLYADYPKLIEKTPEGHFDFKISFLRRSKRFKYFFHMSQDGADAMKNLYNFFSDKNPKYTNYFKVFSGCSDKNLCNPVILIFDNELSNKCKPLHSFVSHIELSSSDKDKLKEDLCMKIIDEGNLFLVTNQLVDGKAECEIEDLFDETTRNHVIAGKTFSSNDKADKEKHYGKEIFANFIQSNYKSINFDNFRPMLNNIVKVIAEFAGTEG